MSSDIKIVKQSSTSCLCYCIMLLCLDDFKETVLKSFLSIFLFVWLILFFFSLIKQIEHFILLLQTS